MLTVLSCIAMDHDYGLVALAALVCVLGSVLTMRLYARVRRTEGLQKINWLFMSGIIGGSTIWTTHFIAMLSYKSSLPHAYEPTLTMLSLAAAIGMTTLGFLVTAMRKTGPTIELGGAIVGGGIALMHYMGMAAYQIMGVLQWDYSTYAASIVIGVVFGAVSANRIARPVTRFCKHGAVVALILAITGMHFTGMSAITILPADLVTIPTAMIPDNVLIIIVLALMGVMLGLGASTYVIDMHSSQIAAERFRYLSLHDPLTGLPNRAALNDYLGERVRRQKADNAKFAVLSFDLDRFKDVNDVHGHAAGDAVLRTVSERMTAILDEGEFLARIGGDEFVALTRNCFLKSDIRAFADRLTHEIVKPVEWDGNTLLVGTSVGIALYPEDARTPEELLAQADLAMYRSKAAGNRMVCFYEPSMDVAARDRALLAMDMRNGIERNEFELYYQRQNNSMTGDVVGLEVLLRWKHPVRGMVSPVEFIPIAEKNGFIHELGDWVLRTACIEAASWKRPLKIAVNVAPAQLADVNLPARVKEILRESGLDASRLELEITESGIIADQQHALQIIRQLKALGVRIAMDDYGTGYSSLSTLQNFPFDKIKIDRAFIGGVTRNRHSAAIVRSTIILAQSLDIPVLAEGVENEAHMDFLRKEGCMEVQGYLFGKPMPLSDLDHVVNGDAGEDEDRNAKPSSAAA
ncbi:diguanylate cyclase (GGDEF)-like protein [Pararhizobium capsulatum DSM 1112]|uniref:Diguanylate cyclase (GGDEF)-like protein n=1 Tax=Pararhizobium capsulatum DSM 1112 TaxID=1121113 RepID=A0ABU0BSI9_9HYPH|nr:bifunctional diguanylate cyclase/phosphodiesterase [Pararhizobium capsulatum]MDQ0321226.1 diguanylate cyclase (GGDEF)-like protein [Pararhizobium capsulatum DSM 1112]